MRIAVVGSGPAGLAAAHQLSQDPRHLITVFETRARFGGRADERLVADSVHHLTCLGVALRPTAQVERLAVDGAGAHLWIHGVAEGFDLALVTTSRAEAQALLTRSGIRRHAGSVPVGKRVYFSEHGCTHAALVRMAADHAGVSTPARDRNVADALRSLARRAGGLTAAHVQYLDLSGQTWPLGAPAVYIANQGSILDVATRHLMVRSLRTPDADVTGAQHLEAGSSVGFVVEGRAAAHGAALAALAVNAPMVPIVATDRPEQRVTRRRPRARVRVVIGEPFYPETSSIDELMDDMRMVVRHLERLAFEEAEAHAPAGWS